MAIIDQPVRTEISTPTIASFDETAEAVLALYAAHGVDYIFMNPGTDTFPLQEAYARRMELGLPCPQAIMCIQPPALPWESFSPCSSFGQPDSAILTMVASPSSGVKVISTRVL